MNALRRFPFLPLLTAAAGLVVVAPSADAESRTWTSTDGKTLEAEFVRVDGDRVLVNRDGRTVPIPLERLSDADRKWVAEQKDTRGSDDRPPTDSEITRISGLLERSLKSADLSDEERGEVAAFVESLLPTKGGAGEPVEWKVSFPKWGGDSDRDSVMITADLFPKGATDGDRLMWFHIIFFDKKREIFTNKEFAGHPAQRYENRHLFVTANRTDVRGVASDKSYQNDGHIDAVMKGIDLKTFARF